MKKLLVLFMTIVLCASLFVACTPAADGNNDETTAGDDTTVADDTTAGDDTTAEPDDTQPADPAAKSEGVMTYAEYAAAEMDAEVVIEAYVQAKQSWWDNKATVYTQDPDGAYFLYEMACSEEDYAKLTVGTKIKVTGVKTAWEGEVEIIDSTFEIVEGNWVAEPTDLTELLGKDELIDHQNKLASFKGMTVEAISFKNNEPGDDIYVTLSKDGASYEFCVEFYLTGTDTDVYKAVEALNAGDVIDVEGFVYWYQGVNPHITAVKAAE